MLYPTFWSVAIKPACFVEKPYEVEHVIVKTDQWLGRKEDLRSWPNKYAGKLATFERGQMSMNNAPYKELGHVTLETGDLITGTLHDSIPEDVSIQGGEPSAFDV